MAEQQQEKVISANESLAHDTSSESSVEVMAQPGEGVADKIWAFLGMANTPADRWQIAEGHADINARTLIIKDSHNHIVLRARYNQIAGARYSPVPSQPGKVDLLVTVKLPSAARPMRQVYAGTFDFT